MPRIALVANTWPLEPNVKTTMLATTTMRSEMNEKSLNEDLKFIVGLVLKVFKVTC